MTIPLTTPSRRLAAGLATALLAALVSAPLPTQATPMKGKMHAKSAATSKVYICTKCKEYYSAASAKKMGYKDDMGHKLVATSKAPSGFANGDKAGGMKMGGM